MEEHLKEGFMEILVALITKLTENLRKQNQIGWLYLARGTLFQKYLSIFNT